MDFAGFLNDCRQQWPSFDSPDELASASHPADRRLAELPRLIEGSATENKLMLLNLAARHLAPGEVYVEIGSWCGLSLAGAAHGNRKTPFYICDNFVRSWSSREALLETIRRHTAPGQVHFHDTDFREFLQVAPWRPARIGAYFYDAGHRFEEQFQALELVRSWLADDALVIVDDTNDAAARAANRLFATHSPGLELVRDIRTRCDCEPTWWNGVQIYRWRATAEPSRPVSAAGFQARRLLYNHMLLVLNRIITAPLWWKNRRWRWERELGRR